MLPAFVDR